jgi:hypothetical protein
MDIDRNLTVVILAHPVKSHPSLNLILKTYNSLSKLNLPSNTKIILSHDAPKTDLSKEMISQFNNYLLELRQYFRYSENVIITVTPKHKFLSGNIRHALSFIKTKYVLLMQHDLAFRANVNIASLLEVMSSNDQIKHVRFNKRDNNIREGWDFYIKQRAEFIREDTFQTSAGEVKLFRTLAWSDQNHLTTVEYYKKLVLPLCRNFRVYPEDMLNPFTRPQLFSVFGNFVYGALDAPATIEDLDGSKGRWDDMSTTDTFLRRLKMALHYRRNKLVLYNLLIRN